MKSLILNKPTWVLSLKLSVALGVVLTLFLFNLALDSSVDEMGRNPLFYPTEAIAGALFEPKLHNPFIAVGVLMVMFGINVIVALPVGLLIVLIWPRRRSAEHHSGG